MSTLTPNYGLYKPENTDSMDDFFDEYAANMDNIDENMGGGGGGGHTIVDENGQSMPSRLKLAFTGNVEVTDDSGNDETLVNILGGGGSDTIVGMFVDTSRIILASTAFTSSYSYTATEDCFAVFYLVPKVNESTRVLIDGVSVTDFWRSQTITDACTFYVKRGQIISVSNADSVNSSYITVYGVTQGTKNIFTPIIYSDNERCIGIWRDNKPLYQKTIDFGTLPNQTTKSVAHGISNIDASCIVSVEPIASTSSYATFPRVHDTNVANQVFWEVDSTNIICYSRNSNNTAFTRCFVTLKYTKTSDSAGSGNWSTDEEPMHHYSTSEHLCGTWIDGKPLYEITVDCGNLPNRATKSVNYGVADVKAIVKLYGIGIASTGATCPLPFSDDYSAAGNILLDANASSGTIRLISQSDKSPFHGYVTMQYTKTTDT